MKNFSTNNKIELETALKDCRAAAIYGYKIVYENLIDTAKEINRVSKLLSECFNSIERGTVNTPGVISQLKSQISSVVNEIEDINRLTKFTLEERRKRLDDFSITLFGRTMSGKSTLMEILTRGNGQSIGNGSQRTTRDIRSYRWNGLIVTDVPGVAAFEGEEDEELALKSAEQADLVIFLITDDAPQLAEAEFLAKVRRLGKPIIGICNVKTAMNDADDLKLLLRPNHVLIDQYRVEKIINQLHELTEQFIISERIPFLVTNLRMRFLAEQPGFEVNREKLITASRFYDIENIIISEIIGRGSFYRIKSFIDGSVTPMMDFTEKLLEFSAQNSRSGRVLIGKKRQFQNWIDSFRVSGMERINSFIFKNINSLRDQVPSFAEDHYEDKSAGRSWEQLINSCGIAHNVEKLQEGLLNECKKEINEVARELKSELELVMHFSSDHNIKMDSIFNTRKYWNWATVIVTGGMAAIALLSGPIGWAAVATVGVIGSLISFMFDDREKKVRRARENLSKKLYKNITKMEMKLRKKLNEWFHKSLFEKQMYILMNDLEVVISALFKLADSQRELAWTLNYRQKKLAHLLLKEALYKLDKKETYKSILDVARVPGFAIMLLIEPEYNFPNQIRRNLETLLSEDVWFVKDTKNKISIISQAIGRKCEKNKIRLDEKTKTAYVPYDEIDVVTKFRVKLAQQLTGFHVMK